MSSIYLLLSQWLHVNAEYDSDFLDFLLSCTTLGRGDWWSEQEPELSRIRKFWSLLQVSDIF